MIYITDEEKYQAIILTKVGSHDNEDLRDILARKKNEDPVWWGYNVIKINDNRFENFLREAKDNNMDIHVLMIPIKKENPPYPKISEIEFNILKSVLEKRCTKYKEEKHGNAKMIPENIVVTGSKWALVFNQFKDSNHKMHPSQYEVYGDKDNKTLKEALKGRFDTSCALLNKNLETKDEPVEVLYEAVLTSPYKVHILDCK
ncbi:MAG: hypothetical protein APG11_00566 [Candidatus Methanofastidiosum methylothiophilum]|uniref:Uncharacterized protein n=1 Tax=Candidatus Methanofastidiosum methylothiophilum TaxID=1705564 RepID=A0A150ITK0_9EURY|nr:MAG: hypothetical protein APG11_00566 [Candidatus Methanofastidiosum methylthiophilus]